MLALLFTDKKANLLQLHPDSDNSWSLKSFQEIDLPDNSFANGQLTNPDEVADLIHPYLPQPEEKLVFILPENAYFTTRIPLSGDATEAEVDREAIKILGIPKANLITSYINLTPENKATKYLHIAIPKEIWGSFTQLFNSLDIVPSAIVPESVLSFTVLHSEVNKTETIGYLPNPASLVFYDHLGPVISVALPGKANISDEIDSEVNNFNKLHKPKVKRLITTSIISPSIKASDIEVLPVHFIIERRLADVTPKGLEGLQIESLNPALLGAFLADLEKAVDFSPLFKNPESVKKPSFFEALSDDSTPQTPLIHPEEANPSQISDQTSTIVSSDNINSESKKSNIKSLILPFIAGCIVTFLAIKLFSSSKSISITPTPTPSPETIISPTPSPVPTLAIDKSTIKIKIQNGTTTSGLAKKFATTLKTGGYTLTDTGNADKQDYVQSLIQLKKSKPELTQTVVPELQTLLKSTTVAQTLDDSASYDIIITLGSDFTKP